VPGMPGFSAQSDLSRGDPFWVGSPPNCDVAAATRNVPLTSIRDSRSNVSNAHGAAIPRRLGERANSTRGRLRSRGKNANDRATENFSLFFYF
jgi:hypothetical protein